MALFISVALIAVVAVVVGFGVALAAKGKREYSQQHQVVPGMKSSAPAAWAGAHSPEAKLHRRLGEAVRAAQSNPRFVELGLGPKVKQVEVEAVAIDERLIAAAALPTSHRADAVNALAPNVVSLEEAVAALVASTTVADSKQLLEQRVSEADIKLQALAQARAEIEQIDRTASGALTDELPPPEPGTATG